MDRRLLGEFRRMALSMGNDEPQLTLDASDTPAHVKTQLLRRVAHDIASPTGVASTVIDELAATASARPELVAMAKRSLRRLMRLSENLALCAELERGELDPERLPADLGALVQKALEDAVAIDGRKGIMTACEVTKDAVSLRVDARLLHMVIREIIGNALKLASAHVAVATEVADDHVTIRVDDDGPGFDGEARATFGHRFVDRRARGLGLSLSMACDVVKTHGGTIAIETSRLSPGRSGVKGAAVLIRLPR